MIIDKSLLLEGFIAESKEHLDIINNSLNSLKENSSDKTQFQSILRELHTIKGTSRMMGFKNVETLTHSIEDVFKYLQDNQLQISSRNLQLVFLSCEVLNKIIKKIEAEGNDETNIESYVNSLKMASKGLIFSLEDLIETTKQIDLTDDSEDEQYSGINEVKSIRIKIDRINEIIESFDDLVIREFKFKHQVDLLHEEEIKTKNPQIRKIRKQIEEDLIQLENSVFDVQHLIFDLRMLPLELVLNPLKRNIELEAINSKKEVTFNIPTTEITLDKMILEPLSEILLHLARNSLDHGIEMPSIRKKLGKPEKGTVKIEAKTISNRILITVSDDGQGIDYDAVRQKAIERIPEQKEDILAMSEKELASFLFLSGFSTSSEVSSLSGRGVGLDIVKKNIERIKGKIHFESEKDKGTTFELSLPLSLATLQGLFVITGKRKLLIPSHYVSEIVHCRKDEYINLQNQNMLRLRDQVFPVYNLSSIIGLNEVTIDKNDCDMVLVVEYLEKKIGIIVSEVLNTVTVIVKPLPKVFENFDALQGIVFDENYDIVPIIHIPNVMERFNNLLSYDLKKFEVKRKRKEHRLLVVEDSLTTRQIEKTILEAENYFVETAVDGIDALDKIKQFTFDCIITDIKMPRMDGLVLIENIRRIKQYEKTPVIVISAVYDEQAKKSFIEAGVQAYIVKSDFERGNLVSTVKELLHD